MAVASRPATGSRRASVIALAQDDRLAECAALARDELEHGGDAVAWIGALIVEAMKLPDLSLAGALAGALAAFERGSEWIPGDGRPRAPLRDAFLSAPKLRHDLAQLRHLRARGLGPAALDELGRGYEESLAALGGVGDNTRVPIGPDDARRIGRAFGRIVHLGHAPRLARALSPRWDREAAQRAYLDRRPGVVVIDDFLDDDALASLQRFALESTVWFANRYADGRLGAFFFAGFNAPLLLQIAEELQRALPALIGPRYPLRQLWGFKNTGVLPADSTIHADFAAVNVNFWITPTEHNLDDASGGMRIYDVDAPPSWDFATYNEQLERIREYLASRPHRVIRVPYRCNRAVIFNSDLFHATEAVRFRPEYEAHRVNVTMLYGERRMDAHHPPAPDDDPQPSAWRSRAWRR